MDVFLSFSVKSENITTKINPEENRKAKEASEIKGQHGVGYQQKLLLSDCYAFSTSRDLIAQILHCDFPLCSQF